jgi:hypothetical protein
MVSNSHFGQVIITLQIHSIYKKKRVQMNIDTWAQHDLCYPAARFNEKGCLQVWGGDALSSLTITWVWEIFLEGHRGWRWNHWSTMLNCNAWSMKSRLDVIINSMFCFSYGCKLLVSSSSFSSEFKDSYWFQTNFGWHLHMGTIWIWQGFKIPELGS